jgi:desulfoferrodoxin-like iron-binding protein
MSKALCTECQFLYDSRQGIPEFHIAAGTPFGAADDSIFSCPQCGSSKDMFMEIQESPVEVEDPNDLTEMEAEHVPLFFFENEELVVRVGAAGMEHPQEVDHSIEWIEIRDGADEVVERVYFGENESPEARFSLDEDEEFSVFACCSEHGIWK